jgi:integrase
MARRVRDTRIETRSSRLRLAVRGKPYWVRIARGIKLGYRRGPGTWSVRVADGHGKDWIRKFADADDHDEADANRVMSFWQAQDAAKALARGKDGTGDDRPITVEEALTAYEKELIANEADPYNANRVRRHLSSTLLTKPVALLKATELRKWRDGLIAKKLVPATVNRTKIGLHAALELAAKSDPRISNRQAWQVGLASLPDAVNARRMILPDANVRSLVAAAFGVDRGLGLLIETVAVTGARLSQLARLTVGDLQADRPDPRLMMPSSRKGGRHKRKVSHVPVPIPATLAAKLAQESRDRPADAPLLLAPDGKAWRHSRNANHHALFDQAIERAGVDPKTTLYHLRHSSIVRMLLNQVPIAVVARLHDTSVKQIESHYGAYIADYADDVSRPALLDMSTIPPLPAPADRGSTQGECRGCVEADIGPDDI